MTTQENRARTWFLPAALLLAALALRLPGMWTELWMDEILSIRYVGGLTSPAGVFTGIHSDNNHYLNSLWLWTVGPDASGWLLRVPPLILGTALVVLAYRLALSEGRRAATITAALFASSYPLVHYASEARGYGYLVFLTLLTFVLFRSWIREGRRRSAVGYALVASFAFLAHLGFLTVFAAFLLWSGLEIRGAGAARGAAVRAHILVHLLPAITLIALYVLDIRWMSAAGGFASLPPLRSLSGAAGLVIGEAPGWPAAVVATGAWIAIAMGAWRRRAEVRNETAFLAAAVLLSLLSGALPGYGYPRYYLTALLFALVLLGSSIAAGVASRRGRVAAIALFALILSANLSQVRQFAAVGRGMYREAVEYMATTSGFGTASVTGSHDLGTVLAIGYYDGGLPAGTEIRYYCQRLSTRGCERTLPDPTRGEGVPAFYLLASLEDRFPISPEVQLPTLGSYRYVRSFPKYGLSGVYWVLYRVSEPAVPG